MSQQDNKNEAREPLLASEPIAQRGELGNWGYSGPKVLAGGVICFLGAGMLWGGEALVDAYVTDSETAQKLKKACRGVGSFILYCGGTVIVFNSGLCKRHSLNPAENKSGVTNSSPLPPTPAATESASTSSTISSSATSTTASSSSSSQDTPVIPEKKQKEGMLKSLFSFVNNFSKSTNKSTDETVPNPIDGDPDLESPLPQGGSTLQSEGSNLTGLKK